MRSRFRLTPFSTLNIHSTTPQSDTSKLGGLCLPLEFWPSGDDSETRTCIEMRCKAMCEFTVGATFGPCAYMFVSRIARIIIRKYYNVKYEYYKQNSVFGIIFFNDSVSAYVSWCTQDYSLNCKMTVWATCIYTCALRQIPPISLWAFLFNFSSSVTRPR